MLKVSWIAKEMKAFIPATAGLGRSHADTETYKTHLLKYLCATTALWRVPPALIPPQQSRDMII